MKRIIPSESELKSLFDDEDLLKRIREESDFGCSEILPYVESLKKVSAASVLEVGCGTGLLVASLSRHFPNLSFSGLEPLAKGFDIFSDTLNKVFRNSKNVELIQSEIESFQSDRKFDLIYSVNVFEHLEDWRKAIDVCVRHLKPGGKLVFLCPNYNVPYEPHFSIPIIVNKKITYKLFQRKIESYHELVGNDGPWKSLNFITLSEVKKMAYQAGYQVAFDKTVFLRMLERLATDPDFSRRHGLFGKFGRLFPFSYSRKIIDFLPANVCPYMKVTIVN